MANAHLKTLLGGTVAKWPGGKVTNTVSATEPLRHFATPMVAGYFVPRFLCILAGLCVFAVWPASAHAGIASGLMKIVMGVLEVPRATLAGTFSGPPIVGTVIGAVAGTLHGAFMVASGAIETVVSAIPLAAKAAPLIPIFF